MTMKRFSNLPLLSALLVTAGLSAHCAGAAETTQSEEQTGTTKGAIIPACDDDGGGIRLNMNINRITTLRWRFVVLLTAGAAVHCTIPIDQTATSSDALTVQSDDAAHVRMVDGGDENEVLVRLVDAPDEWKPQHPSPDFNLLWGVGSDRGGRELGGLLGNRGNIAAVRRETTGAFDKADELGLVGAAAHRTPGDAIDVG